MVNKNDSISFIESLSVNIQHTNKKFYIPEFLIYVFCITVFDHCLHTCCVFVA